MRPVEVRTHVLSDHEKLRQLLTRLEGLARDAIAGSRLAPGALRSEAEFLLERLGVHMTWEDDHLVPVLREADAWGEARCERFADEHREQRELLHYALAQLQDDSRPENVVAANVLDLIALLREDMQEEESVFLDERVLRDDVIGIDVDTG